MGIRDDLVTEAWNRIPESSVTTSTIEKALPPRAREVVQALERSRNSAAKTLPEFYELFSKVIAAAEEADGKAYNLKVVKSYPTTNAKFPIVTVRLRSRGPWTDGKGIKELMPRFMEEVPDIQNPGDAIMTFLRRQRNIVEMKVWARDGESCDEITDWLEETFYEYLWIFQWGGLSHPVVWLGREADMVYNERQNQMYSSTVTMQVDTAILTFRRTAQLRKVILSVGLDSTQIEVPPDAS